MMLSVRAVCGHCCEEQVRFLNAVRLQKQPFFSLDV